MRQYAFEKAWKRWLALGLDLTGEALAGRDPFSTPIEMEPRRSAPGRTLVLRLDQLGDVVQTLPFFDALATRFPRDPVEVLTTSAGARILGRHAAISRVHVWDCPWFQGKRLDLGGFLWLTHFLRQGRYRRTVHLRGDLFPLLCAWWAGVPERLGYAPTGGSFLLTRGVPWQRDLHAVKKNLSLALLLGATPGDPVPRLPEPSFPPEDLPELPGCYLAIHPDAGAEAKLWPEEHFVDLLARVLDSHRKVSAVLVGLDSDRGARIYTALIARSPDFRHRVQSRMGQTDLPGLIQVLRGCEALVTNDSGPGHVAAALGRPVYLLWSGVAPSQVWRPLGPRVTLFQAPTPCSPCSLRSCPVPGHPCLRDIDPETVATALGKLLDPR